MDIVEAINLRKSIRAFKPDPVPLDVLKQILGLASRAPSWANTQPWEFAIVTGSKLEEIRKARIERAGERFPADIPGPREYAGAYDARRGAVAARILEAKGVRREDMQGRGSWILEGLNFFGAPCVIYLCIDRSFYFQGGGVNAWAMFDSGMVAQNIMLLATNCGLGTVPQAQAVSSPDVIRKVLQLPDSRLIALGIAIGYPDWDDPVNQFRTEREPLDKISTWHGFD